MRRWKQRKYVTNNKKIDYEKNECKNKEIVKQVQIQRVDTIEIMRCKKAKQIDLVERMLVDRSKSEMECLSPRVTNIQLDASNLSDYCLNNRL